MRVRHMATGRVVNVHEKAVDLYLANGWEAVKDESKPSAKRRRASARKAADGDGEAEG